MGRGIIYRSVGEPHEMPRDFKGVWIPAEIWLDENLTMLEKVIFTEIESLSWLESGCYASNAYFANFCQCSESKVSKAISKLIKGGYIQEPTFDGRQRHIKSAVCLWKEDGESQKMTGRVVKNDRQGSIFYEADSQKMTDNNIDNNIVTNTKKYTTPNKPNYDSFVDAFNSTCVSLPKVVKLTDKRKKKIDARLKTFSEQEILSAFAIAEQSDFLSGRSSNWKASFDWIMESDNNMLKILEGNYNHHKKTAMDRLKEAHDRLQEEIDGYERNPNY